MASRGRHCVEEGRERGAGLQ
uniref:Uncharacterized protein n=1 Tax=Anguilla anguilla TaxID=7936 RepID=A0A0E9XRD3_ANGAN